MMNLKNKAISYLRKVSIIYIFLLGLISLVSASAYVYFCKLSSLSQINNFISEIENGVLKSFFLINEEIKKSSIMETTKYVDSFYLISNVFLKKDFRDSEIYILIESDRLQYKIGLGGIKQTNNIKFQNTKQMYLNQENKKCIFSYIRPTDFNENDVFLGVSLELNSSIFKNISKKMFITSFMDGPITASSVSLTIDKKAFAALLSVIIISLSLLDCFYRKVIYNFKKKFTPKIEINKLNKEINYYKRLIEYYEHRKSEIKYIDEKSLIELNNICLSSKACINYMSNFIDGKIDKECLETLKILKSNVENFKKKCFFDIDDVQEVSIADIVKRCKRLSIFDFYIKHVELEIKYLEEEIVILNVDGFVLILSAILNLSLRNSPANSKVSMMITIKNEFICVSIEDSGYSQEYSLERREMFDPRVIDISEIKAVLNEWSGYLECKSDDTGNKYYVEAMLGTSFKDRADNEEKVVRIY